MQAVTPTLIPGHHPLPYDPSQAQGGFMLYPQPRPVATITLADRTVITFPAEQLPVMINNLTKTVQRTQENNAVVAASVLVSAISAIVDFEEAFKTFFSTGDDSTAIASMNQCLAELRQANAPQTSTVAHPFASLVTAEESWITDAREIFEHCIKTIQNFLPCLTGRQGFRSHEMFSQTFSWTGWIQQTKQIEVNNRVIGALLDKFKKENPDQALIPEIRCFHDSVNYIVECYLKKQYPVRETFMYIYEIQGINRHILSFREEAPPETIKASKNKTAKLANGVI